MSEHTPGPWCQSSSVLVCTEVGRVVANCLPVAAPDLDLPYREADANARLIAAAPDLLAACEVALTTPGMVRGRDAMRVAVAQATGSEVPR